jgi:hypothetical protein
MMDALKPVTDNPDEAEYLGRVRNTLESKGIWLRFDNQLVRDPEEHGRWIVDPRTFRAWLCVGYDGDAIPTNDGQLDREEMLGTALFGAGYYDAVQRRGGGRRDHRRRTDAMSTYSAVDFEDGDKAVAHHHRITLVGPQAAPGATGGEQRDTGIIRCYRFTRNEPAITGRVWRQRPPDNETIDLGGSYSDVTH